SHDVVLEVRNLRRSNAIQDVSFKLRKGEILGFAGLMGAGKTVFASSMVAYLVRTCAKDEIVAHHFCRLQRFWLITSIMC
ncbi:MAG: hypothetical protein EOO61_22665, partial [Hymenobacter sp.]